MEQLKAFNELTLPDERQSFFTQFDPTVGDFRPVRAEDTYARVETVRLHAGVPESVRNHFATAQNLIAYSWFYYPFNVTAELMAYVSVEFALTARYPSNTRDSFKALLSRAVREGLVKSSAFSVAQAMERERQVRRVPTQEEVPRADYAAILVNVIPALRNSLAHGSNSLHMHGASAVRTCAELINQMFPAPTQETTDDHP